MVSVFETRTWATVTLVGISPSFSRVNRDLAADFLTRTPGLFGTAYHENTKLHRHDVELLPNIFADSVRAIAAAGAFMALNVGDNIDARQRGLSLPTAQEQTRAIYSKIRVES